MSALTDTIQATVGVAGLAVAVLALRESRLQRRASERASAPPPTGQATEPAPQVVPAPPPVRPTENERSTTVPQLRYSRAVPYVIIAAALYFVLTNVLLTGPTIWLILAFVLLALSVGVLLWLRHAPVHSANTVGFIAGALGAASLFTALNVFIPPGAPKTTLITAAVVVPLAVIWLIIDKVRPASRRSV